MTPGTADTGVAEGVNHAPSEHPGFQLATPTMLVRRKNEPWRPPKVTGYRAEPTSGELFGEEALKMLVADSPELLGLPGAAVATELAVPDTGSLDIACVDHAGAITLVECKLRDNAEIRRTVVGQVLAYGAGLWGLGYEEFERRFNARAKHPLLKTARRGVDEEDWDEEAFREAVAKNLSTGRFDLIIAVDAITDELKRIVRYLNEHTVSEIRVLAFELGYARDDDIEILVPVIYGQEVKPPPGGPVWDEDKLFDVLAKRSSDAGVAAVRRIYDHAVERGATFSWGRAPLPSVTAVFDVDGASAGIWTCYTHETPNIAVNFEWMRKAAPKERLARFAERVRELSNGDARLAGLEEAGWKRRPGLSIVEVFSPPGAAGSFCEALDELVGGGDR